MATTSDRGGGEGTQQLGRARLEGNADPGGVARTASGVGGRHRNATLKWSFAGVGLAALVVAAVAEPSACRSAAAQDWPPFVLVSGLLLVGLVADDDGLFAAAGHRLARAAPSGIVLFFGAATIVGAVTAVLNLDTSVAFLTPVLVYAARSRGEGEAPLLYGCLLLSNAGSLFLPGSNLTNLIVLGHLDLSGGQFLTAMWAPALAALLVTAAVVAALEHRELRVRVEKPIPTARPVLGVGLAGIVAVVALVVILRSPAIPVAGVGIAATGIRWFTHKDQARRATDRVGFPALAGLFGVAVTLGVVGRSWSAPATLLSHLDVWGTAALAAASSVVVNNLPAASLLSARAPGHPLALLIGLNLGPNLFATGSLAWFLWLRAARAAGARPSITKASRMGTIAVPLSMAAAVGALLLTSGPR